MSSILARVTPSDIRCDPFPHVFVPDVLDPAEYAALAEGYPSLEQVTWVGEHKGSNRRYEMPAWILLDHPDIPEVWKAFVRRHTDPSFFAEVVTLFQEHWPALMLAALDGSLNGHATGLLRHGCFETMRVGLDARFEINTPVTGTASVSRGAHLDRPERLYSGLLYFRHPDDDSEGGDLVLYRWRPGAERSVDHFQLPDSAVEEVQRIPYRANQLVLFPNGIDALHGVGLRHPTPHMRRYVFITAELGTRWLTVEGAGA